MSKRWPSNGEWLGAGKPETGSAEADTRTALRDRQNELVIDKSGSTCEGAKMASNVF